MTQNKVFKMFIKIHYDDFKGIWMGILGAHAPMKKKVVRGNNVPFMSKILSKEIMHRTKLNKFNKDLTEMNKRLYNRQISV